MNLARWRFIAAAGAALTLLTAAAGRLSAQGATITGRVTAVVGGQPIPDARILVIGTAIAGTTAEDGKFTLRNLPTGTAQLQVLRVGYQSEKRSVPVTAGQTVNADFALNTAVAQLEQIVTTATGQQRKIEIGNAVATLGDVGKNVENLPVTQIQDLITGKTPGVSVLPGAVVGAAPTIRVRGISSISLDNAPIWIVDGVRYLTNTTSSAGSTNNSLLNNLSPEEIEDIEIVKGPSAATLYGTNAANGVVVVTTKKGKAGKTKWNLTAENRAIDDRNHYQTQYANFGHNIGSTAPIRCQIAVMVTSAYTPADGAACVSDSLTSYNFMADPSNTFIGIGRGSLYGAQVSGGSDAVRFFVSGDLSNEYGPIQMPQHDIDYYNNVLHQPVSSVMFHPRQANLMNYRTNLSAALSPKLDLNVNAGFGRSVNYVEPDNGSIIGLLYTGQNTYGWKGCPAGLELTGCGMTGADNKPWYTSVKDPTSFPLNDANGFAPGSVMQFITPNVTNRFTGSFDSNWRPLSWLATAGTVGLDLANNDAFHVCLLQQCPNQNPNAVAGNVQDDKQNRRNISAKLSAAASWQYRPSLTFKTSVGTEYTNVANDELFAQGRGLAPGASTLASTSAFVQYRANQSTAVKTLGYYVQEEAAIRDRLFLTVAARQDQNSAFGTNFQSIVYPKVSASWLISDEGFFPKPTWLSSFRLRSAYGANGVQPGATAALQTFKAATQSIAKLNGNTGSDLSGLTADQPASPKLKPETSAELELGFETDLFQQRVHFDYTFYKKNTKDALIALPIPASVGSSVTSLQQNVGKTQNMGNEATLNATLLDRRNFGWDVTVSGSHNNNKWVSLGDDPSTCTTAADGTVSGCQERVIGAGTPVQQRQGDPLQNVWYNRYTYADANHDGVIQPSEVLVDSTLTSAGAGYAKDIVGIQNGFDLFNRRVRINATFDYQSGGNKLDDNYFRCSSTPKACQETNDPSTPLDLQARAVALIYGTRYPNGTTYTTRFGYYRSNQFWKFRELSASIQLPQRINHYLQSQNGSSFVIGMRNLHTWSSYTGIDPEENFGVGNTTSNRSLPEVSGDFNSSPPPSYFTFRLNLKY
jgi:TonB-linked SusC/RagA family outer membrane protein